MKEKLLAAITALAIPVFCLGAEPIVPTPAATRSIAVTIVGQPDTNLLNRVASIIGQCCRCAVSLKPAQSGMGSAPEKEATELAKLMGSNDVCLVALVNVPEDVKFRRGTFFSHNLALLNTWALRPDEKPVTDQNREKYYRRVEKEALGSIGQLLGLEPCPFLRCCMYAWDTPQELDEKARDFCPVCFVKAEKIFIEKGLISPEQ